MQVSDWPVAVSYGHPRAFDLSFAQGRSFRKMSWLLHNELNAQYDSQNQQNHSILTFWAIKKDKIVTFDSNFI